MIKKIPKDYIDSGKGTLKLLWEEEWRSLGITQVYTPEEVGDREERECSQNSAESWMGTL